MANGKVTVAQGQGSNLKLVATYEVVEDGDTKSLQRIVLSTSAGVEVSPATAAGQGTALAALTSIDGHVDGIEALIALTNTALAALPQNNQRPAPTSVDVTIANAASLSGAAQIDGHLAGLIIPATWTAAALTFRGSTDGVTYHDLVDIVAGLRVERTIPSAAITVNDFIVLSPSDWIGINYLIVRSGTAATPVNQGGSRALTLVKGG